MAYTRKMAGKVPVLKQDLVFDATPTPGSLNPVTSGGVAEKVEQQSSNLAPDYTKTTYPANSYVMQGGVLYTNPNAIGTAEDWNPAHWTQTAVAEAVGAISEAIPEGASEENKLVDQATLDEATAAWSEGYTPKGPASVSTLNGLSGQENGDRYVLTDGGTLTDGSVVVAAGDEVAWDGTGEKWYLVNQYLLKEDGVKAERNAIFGGWGKNLSDLNNAPINSIINITASNLTTTQHLPSNFLDMSDGTRAVLYTLKYIYNNSGDYQVVQLLKRITDGAIWHRTYSSPSSTWSEWATNGSLSVENYYIWSNWARNISDLNNAQDNSIILVTATSGTTTSNFPVDFVNNGSGTVGIVKTYKAYYTTSGKYRKYQVLERISDSVVWFRNYTSDVNTWSGWTKSAVPTNIVEIGAGKTYTTLRAGFTEAIKTYGTKVIVYPGNYDLVQEFADVLPTLSSSSAGVPVGNGMHAIFMAGSHVSAMVEKGDYTDDQFNAIKLHFAPFDFKHTPNGSDDFIVEGLNLSAKNSRYCFHDDFGSDQYPCVHKFINCKMYRENSNITASNNFVQCIGGGLGIHTTVVIEGGYYESNPAIGPSNVESGDPEYGQQCISYHNTTRADADSESSITIKNVYFADKGYFSAGIIGGSLVKTPVYLSGNRFGLPPMVKRQYDNNTDPINFEIKAEWNNEVANEGSWTYDENLYNATWTPSA